MSEGGFDFTSILDRENTGSLKYNKYAGKDVIALWVADMDFTSPPCVIDALKEKADYGVFGYTLPFDGVVNAVLQYLQESHDYVAKKEDLVWLPGLVPALNVVCRAFAAEGEAVMTCSPVYPPFLLAPGFAGRALIDVPLAWQSGRWTFDWEAMEAAVTPETKLFLLCSPHNPVGRVWDEAELRRLLEFCEQHDLVLCSDEIHCDLILDDKRHHMTAGLSEQAAQRIVTLMAPSKTYNVPGLACSFAIIANAQLRSIFQRAARGIITEVNVMGYVACEAAFREGESWRQALLQVLRSNRDLLYSYVQEHLQPITLAPMEATYLAWLRVADLGVSDAAAFFEEHGVGLSDGAFFGDGNYLRINFGCPQATLLEGLQRMKKAVDSLR